MPRISINANQFQKTPPYFQRTYTNIYLNYNKNKQTIIFIKRENEIYYNGKTKKESL